MLKNKDKAKIRDQASTLLTAWYKRIKTTLKPEGVILLMGENASMLLNNSYMKENADVFIDFEYDNKNSTRLSKQLDKDGYKVYSIIHQSIIRFPKNENAWKQNIVRLEVNKRLANEYPHTVKDLT